MKKKNANEMHKKRHIIIHSFIYRKSTNVSRSSFFYIDRNIYIFSVNGRVKGKSWKSKRKKNEYIRFKTIENSFKNMYFSLVSSKRERKKKGNLLNKVLWG